MQLTHIKMWNFGVKKPVPILNMLFERLMNYECKVNVFPSECKLLKGLKFFWSDDCVAKINEDSKLFIYNIMIFYKLFFFARFSKNFDIHSLNLHYVTICIVYIRKCMEFSS